MFTLGTWVLTKILQYVMYALKAIDKDINRKCEIWKPTSISNFMHLTTMTNFMKFQKNTRDH